MLQQTDPSTSKVQLYLKFGLKNMSSYPFTRYVNAGNPGRGIAFENGPGWREKRRFTLKALRDLGFGKENTANLIREQVGMNILSQNSRGMLYLIARTFINIRCKICAPGYAGERAIHSILTPSSTLPLSTGSSRSWLERKPRKVWIQRLLDSYTR